MPSKVTFGFTPPVVYAMFIKSGKQDAYEAGKAVAADPKYGKAYAEAVALSLVPHKQLFKEFMCGYNGVPKPDLDNNGNVVKPKKKLQVAAKPSTNDPTDKFSKEATVPIQANVTTQEEFLALSGKEPASLEGGFDLLVGHPVTGTSKGAVYYVVARLEGLLVAMRWKGAQLSVRIAGPKLADYAARLTAPGTFANHAAEGYFSAHLGQQGAIDDLAGSVSAQMLYASVLAAVTSDLSNYIERAPYAWRNWTSQAAQQAVETPSA